jgi:hypothetical protein
MVSSGMWYRVGLLYTDVPEERAGSIFRLEKITQANVLDGC